jgi:hypothetical protein
MRPVFMARLVEYLQAHSDPGPGDIDRAIRQALEGLWVPPDLAAGAPGRASKYR